MRFCVIRRVEKPVHGQLFCVCQLEYIQYREFLAWGRYEMDGDKWKGFVENIKIISLLCKWYGALKQLSLKWTE